MFRLPISGHEIEVRLPAGSDEIMLLEHQGAEPEVAIALAGRLAVRVTGERLDARPLTVTDLETVLLLVRRAVFGDLVHTDVRCPARDCGARVDVDFGIDDYLAYHAARMPRGVAPTADEGWYQLKDRDVLFRLPSCADQAEALRAPDPEHELIRRCLRPADAPARVRTQAQNAMAAMAPVLSDAVQGRCPECGIAFDMYFDVQSFVLAELRGQAAFLYEDMHLLAGRYHWSEEEILQIPSRRRAHYAAMISGEEH
jgi:hypothetical protein